ncbi:hypothetical protein F4703DRAFT_1866775 [Phycomyces blakesleeanus]
MRHVNGRAIDLFITTLVPETILADFSQRLLVPISNGIGRCTKCQWAFQATHNTISRKASQKHQLTRRILRPSVLTRFSSLPFQTTYFSTSTRRFISALPTILDENDMSNDLPQAQIQTQIQMQLPLKNEPKKGELLRESSAAIISFASQGRVDEALARYFHLLGSGGFPSQEALYQLSRALYRASNLAGMYALHDTLLLYYKSKLPSKRQLRSMLYMYTMLINLIGRKTKITPNDMERIKELCGEMESLNIKSTVVLYNTLIKMFVTMKDWTGAYAIYDELLRKNLRPTHYTYSILMQASAQQRDLEKISELMDAMEEHQVLPDRAIVSILVGVLCNIREFDSALELSEQAFNLMQSTEMGAKFWNHLKVSIVSKKHNFTLKKRKRYMLKKAKKRALKDL